MKILVLIVLFLGFINASPVYAQELAGSSAKPLDSRNIDPGAVEVGESLIPPTSPLYPLKSFREKIEMALTFSDEGRVVRQLEFAQRRLREVRSLVKGKRQDLIEKTLKDYKNHLDQAQSYAQKSEDLKVKVGEATSRHSDVLQKVYDSVGNDTAKKALLNNIEKSDEQVQKLLNNLSSIKQEVLFSKIVLRRVATCQFLGRESTSSGVSQDQKNDLSSRFKKCQLDATDSATVK